MIVAITKDELAKILGHDSYYAMVEFSGAPLKGFAIVPGIKCDVSAIYERLQKIGSLRKCLENAQGILIAAAETLEPVLAVVDDFTAPDEQPKAA